MMHISHPGMTQIRSCLVHFVKYQGNTLVPIKMSVSSLTTLHTPRQTLSFSTVSKEQPLFKSVTGLTPVFQPI